jgi:hypothetical protein
MLSRREASLWHSRREILARGEIRISVLLAGHPAPADTALDAS